MQTRNQILDLLRRTTEVAQRSAALKDRAQESIFQSALIIENSRKLLAAWPVFGIPTLSNWQREEAPSPTAKISPASDTKRTSATAAAALERVVEQDFTQETVMLDGRHFVDCNIANCILDYSGGPVVLEGTHFTGCRFRFGGEAAMTLSMLECFGLIGKEGAEVQRSPSNRSDSAYVN